MLITNSLYQFIILTAISSILIGSVTGLTERKLKSLLAYSSIILKFNILKNMYKIEIILTIIIIISLLAGLFGRYYLDEKGFLFFFAIIGFTFLFLIFGFCLYILIKHNLYFVNFMLGWYSIKVTKLTIVIGLVFSIVGLLCTFFYKKIDDFFS